MKRGGCWVFLLALLPRLPGLGLFVTTDEPYFAQKAAEVILALLRGDLHGTYWHFYPGVTMSWLDAIGLLGQWTAERLVAGSNLAFSDHIQRGILDLLVATRLPYALLSAGAVAATYGLVRRLFDGRVAWLAALLLAFDPFFLAHSRVAHGDAPVSVFITLSALAFFVYLKRRRSAEAAELAAPAGQGASIPASSGTGSVAACPQPEGRRRWLVLSALGGGLAALTKAPGQFMAPFVLAIAAGDWLWQSWRRRRLEWQQARRWSGALMLWGVLAAALFIALWPAMWTSPVETLSRMLQETFGKVEAGHLVMFMGQPTLDPGPWFYPYVIAMRLTPVSLIGVVLSVAVLGAVAITSARAERVEHYQAACWMWLVVLGLFVFGELSPKKQDRYLLAVFPFLNILAAFAFNELGLRLAPYLARLRRGLPPAATWPGQFAVVSSLIVVLHGLPVLTTYPYYLAYFNPLLGGLPRAVQTTLVGWGEGMEQVAAYLNQRPDAERTYVAAVPFQTLQPFFKGMGENFYTNAAALRADVVVLYISQVQRLAPSPEIVRYFQSRQPEHVVNVLGVPYAWVYPGLRLLTGERPDMPHPAEIIFGEWLKLVGYGLTRQADAAQVTLLWQALAPVDRDYTVSVRLVAADGRRLAQHDGWPAAGLLPTSQWRPGEYVRDVHQLALPVGDEPRWVQLVVYDAADGRPLGPPANLPFAPDAQQEPPR